MQICKIFIQLIQLHMISVQNGAYPFLQHDLSVNIQKISMPAFELLIIIHIIGIIILRIVSIIIRLFKIVILIFKCNSPQSDLFSIQFMHNIHIKIWPKQHINTYEKPIRNHLLGRA